MGLIITDLSEVKGKRLIVPLKIENFHRVDSKVLRGAQPSATDLRALKDMGVTDIVCLRENDYLPEEPGCCANLGMAFHHVPLDPFVAPIRDSLNRVLAIIENTKGQVFIHCQYGCDRTGTVIAIYRITKGETNQAAFDDAVKHGLSSWETGMRELIKNYKA